MKGNKYFVIIVISQFLIVFFLGYKIFEKNRNILSLTASINPIKKETIDLNPNSKLKYFYEPKANSINITKEAFLLHEVKNTINGDALNERFEYSIQKKEDVFRIITLGDSFTYGENVSTENNWTELLEDYLNKTAICNKITKYEIINLGMEGYDTQYEVERYKIRGEKYNPDLVLWLFTDYERILEQMMPLIKQNDTKENKDLEKKEVFFNNWRISREEMLKKIGKNDIKKYQIQQIEQIDKYYKGHLLFMTFPDKPEYVSLLQHRTEERPNTFFFQPNIKFEEKQLFLSDGHFNESGHKKMMKEVVGYLTKNKLISCTQQMNQ